MKSKITLLAVLASTLFTTNLAVAEDEFRLSLGSYIVARADTTIAANERNVGAGVSIDPHNTLGTDLEQSVFRLDGIYSFNSESSILFSWYKISNSGSNQAQKDFTWVGQDGEEYTITAGSSVASKLTYEIFKANYNWTFYKSEKVSLFSSAGLHMTRFGVDVEVTNDVSGSPSTTSARDIDSTIPLPALGLGVIYHISPKWLWYMQAELFAMKYDDWTGTYSDLLLGIDYRAFKHFSIGVGIGSNNLNVLEETDDYRFSYDNRITGINVQLSTYF